MLKESSDHQDQNSGSQKQETQNDSKVSTSIFPRHQPSKLCIYYSNYGYCKYGQNCKFSHRRKTFFTREFSRREFSSQRSYKEKSVFKNLTLPQTDNSISAETESKDSSLSVNTKGNKKLNNRLCRYYKAGHCEQGDSCLYSHNLDKIRNIELDSTILSSNEEYRKNISKFKKRSIPICNYFRRGFCQKGDLCKFYHNPRYVKENSFSVAEANEMSSIHKERNCSRENLLEQKDKHNAYSAQSIAVDDENSKKKLENKNFDSDINKTQPQSEDVSHNSSENLLTLRNLNLDSNTNIVYTPYGSKNISQFVPNARIFDLSSMSENETDRLRNTEITQLKKRFPKHEENVSSFSFDFEPTDPDWPYDLKALRLQVTFPENYPIEICEITVLQSTDYISELLLRHLNQSISDWLNQKHKSSVENNQVILIFRPFLKWFDKNLETIFNCGLKKMEQDAEIQQDQIESVAVEYSLCESDAPGNSLEQQVSLSPTTSTNPDELEKDTNEHSEQKNSAYLHDYSQQNGVKVIFTGLELLEGVAAVSCKKLAATVYCGRCKTPSNVKFIPNKNVSIVCSKCSKSMQCNFNPSILHQFSSVLGTIHLLECQAADVNLVECAFLIDCLNCAKQVPIEGLHYGQKQKLWCKFCNQKLLIGIEGVKFQATTSPTASLGTTKSPVAKKAVKKKDPVIKEGCPLPEYGSCKHYKKSYRWLRFPCCGRLYPCDICHDEKETDHDMKYASRMVCGYCSKEQPYSRDKPCFGCSANVVKKSGSHWEGGKGCRNSIVMSRNDKHKYAGTNKTTSKKSQPSGKIKK